MNVALWAAAIVLAVVFLTAGVMKVFRYEQARQQLPWVKDAPRGLVTFIGIVEILGAVGLILPAVTGILPWLTPLAALGLALVMIPAGALHVSRHEYSSIGMNLVLMLLAIFVAYGRVTLVPLS